MNPAATATRAEDIQGDNRWMDMHESFIEETMSMEPDVLLIGDSILHNLIYTPIWKSSFEPLHALNFGIGGDQTQNILWRVQNGELEIIKPKVIVLHVGTNNFGHTPEQISEGIIAIVNVIQEKQPQAYLIIPTLLPRGKKPNKLRDRNSKVNELLMTELKHQKNVHVLDVTAGLVDEDGIISIKDMHDFLHLTVRGYNKVLSPLFDLIYQVLTQGEENELDLEDLSDNASAFPNPPPVQ